MWSVGDVAKSLGFEADGDLTLQVRTASHPAEASPADLALALDDVHAEALKEGEAEAAMMAPGADWRAHGLRAVLFAPRPRYAMAGATTLFAAPIDLAPGVHASAAVAEDAEIGEDVWIGPFTVIGPGARIGRGARICGQVSVGAGAEIGESVLLHPGVRIGHAVRIGARTRVHHNAVVGGDGFSFVTPETGSVESAKQSGTIAVGAENTVWARIHSLGAVVVGADVEIGCCATIDRGTVIDTRIGDGAKIDNQVQIGHNCQVGQNCMLCGQVGLAGSVVLGDRVVLGGQVGVADHTRIGHDALVMASSGVATNLKARGIYGGSPALPRDEITRILLATRRLPRLASDVQSLKKRLSKGEGTG